MVGIHFVSEIHVDLPGFLLVHVILLAYSNNNEKP
jgi:hypothetical protein